MCAIRCLLVIVSVIAGEACLAAQAPLASPVPDSAGPQGRTEPESNLINLPTTKSLKRHGSYFRLTHRFTRDLRRGSFGQLVEDLFGLDNGAVIGLEYRFAPMGNLQAGVHRSMLFKTIQAFGRYDAWRQSDSLPVSISALGSIEGDENFSEHYQTGIGAVVSRTFNGVVAIYTSPIFVWNTPTLATGHEEHEHEHERSARVEAQLDGNNTFFLGLGGRLRFRPTAYLVVEYSPRLAGHDPGDAAWAVGIEKFTRGHGFQLNVTNSFGTTYGQIARGGEPDTIYLGFNITRRF